MAYPQNVYEAYCQEVDALTIPADMRAVELLGVLTRAVKRGQMVIDRELAPIGQRAPKPVAE